MPLESIGPALKKAQTGGYALPCFLTFDLLSAEGLFAALEEKRAPAMIGIYSAWLDKPTGAALAQAVCTLARQARVPVSLMLDHGASLEQCVKALTYGFTDLMYDGSKLPLEENIANTRQIVRAAHAVGAQVEAELGHVGSGSEYQSYGAQRKGFTDPSIVERFVAETGSDILAVAVGSAHGVYQGEPNLDLALLDEIRQRVDVPLSMHGGSGLSDAQFRAAIAHGINKINIFTDLGLTAGRRMVEAAKSPEASYFSILQAIRDAFHARSGDYLDLFGATGRA